MFIFKLLGCVVLLMVVPFLVGRTICRFVNIRSGVEKCTVIGMVTMLFLCCALTIPIVLFGLSYLIVENVLVAVCFAIMIFGGVKGYYTIKKEKIKKRLKLIKKGDVLGYSCVFLSTVLLVSLCVMLSYKHSYLARITEWVMDVVKTDRFFTVDPATGKELSEASIGTKTIIISPVVCFGAFCSRMLSVHPAIMLHTILPVFVVIYLYLLISLMIKKLSEKTFVISGLMILFVSFGFACMVLTKGVKTGRFERTDNYYKISSDSIEIYKEILENDKHSKCVLPYELLTDVRQYSSELDLIYGLDGNGNPVYYSEGYESVYASMESAEPDYDLIFDYALYDDCNVIVLPSDKVVDDSILDKYGYNNIKEVSGYNIYYNTFYNWKITQYGDNEGNQSSFYTIEAPDGGLTIVDGGWDSQYEMVWNVIEEHDYHVDNWIISHPHFDHVGAFNHIMSDPELRDQVTIDKIYATPVNEERYEETAQEYDVYEDYLTFKEIEKDLDNIIYVHEGEEYRVGGLKMKIISAWNEDVDSLPDHLCNDGSLMFEMIGIKESMLFCSDVQSEMEQFILPEHSDDIKADYVQCGHHGNWGLTTDFYDLVDPKVAFMDTPSSIVEMTDGMYDGYLMKDYLIENGVLVYTFDGAPHTITLE